ncbi:Phage tail-collar fibre protein [Balnearium lithotrophicum]|uniref:Phage tail-collar fibre protein n=1 Tax=Balnearium lithotrophicum TaxID=223788 RepID=A0A521DRY8_9BACT|nr:phage tail protein [Balnearium lithotrophicum]SMO74467.1 Phage tail-collar fibre protein [Balnearium lithotrophicum]
MAEEIKLIPITTTAGLQKFFQASGLPEVKLKLTHIGFGDAGYTPDKDQTSLKNEIIRVPISSGKVFPSDGYMDLSALIPEDVPEFWIREIGWYLEDGTLAFVWSHPEVPIAWKNKNLKLLAGISIRVTDVPLDKVEVVESNPDLKLLYTEEFMQISQILTNHEVAIVAVRDKAEQAMETANDTKEKLEALLPYVSDIDKKTADIENNLLLEELTDQTVLARIGNAITDISEKLRVVNTSKLNEVEEEIDKIEKLLAQVKEKVDSDVVAGFQSEIDDIKTQIENLKNSKADKSYVDSTFAKTSDLDSYATKNYLTTQLSSYATRKYVDDNFLKKSELDLKVYTFRGDSTTKWLKVATLDGIDDNTGFSLQFKVINNGDFGCIGRQTDFVHFTERFGYFQLTDFVISDIGDCYGAGAPPCEFGYVVTGDHTADFYIKLNMYNMPVITDIFIWNGTLLFDKPLVLTEEPENIRYATKKMLFNNQ